MLSVLCSKELSETTIIEEILDYPVSFSNSHNCLDCVYQMWMALSSHQEQGGNINFVFCISCGSMFLSNMD